MLPQCIPDDFCSNPSRQSVPVPLLCFQLLRSGHDPGEGGESLNPLVARSVTVYPFRFAAMSDLADEVSDSLPSKKKDQQSLVF